MMNAAVIGAGLAGLCTIRQLTKYNHLFHKLMVFEQANVIGGVWAYTEKAGLDEHGLRTYYPSMYEECQTNNTVPAVTFPDFPHPIAHEPGSFLNWDDVLKYMNDYADHFDLRKYIRLRTVVERVHPEVQENGAVKWDVQVRQVDKPDAVTEKHYFDAVFVCNGRYAVPLMPDIPGLCEFEGLTLHSADFRVCDTFAGQRVVVVGGGPSGVDMGSLIAKSAKKVYLSHTSPFLTSECIFPDNCTLVPEIKLVKKRAVVLENGDEIEADSLFLCTGYRYSFPFLSAKCSLSIDRERMHPLYKHMIHVEFPSLFFIGMPKINPAFLFFHLQAEFCVAVVRGEIKLPSSDEMLQDTQEDYDRRLALGYPHSQAHHTFPSMVHLKPYQEGLLDLCEDKTILTMLSEDLLDHYDHEAPILFYSPRLFRTRKYPYRETDWSKIPTIKSPAKKIN